MPLDEQTLALLRTAAAQERVDPNALIAIAEAEGAEPKGAAERMLIGYLPWVKVKELRAKLGLTERVEGDEELCLAYGIKRGFIAPPSAETKKDRNEDAE